MTGLPVDRIRVAVIGGGENPEHEVSLASAASVVLALSRDRFDVVALTIDRAGVWLDGRGDRLGADRATSLMAAVAVLSSCDAVFPMVHGPRGEDGALAALCDFAGVPVVGSGLRAGAIAMDKWATKAAARELGIGVADGTLVHAGDRVVTSFPAVVKPVAAGSSHGVRVVHSADELAEALAVALELDDAALVEAFVRGREIDIAVLERADGTRLVSNPLEITLAESTVFDTAQKYDGSARFQVPADLAATELHTVRTAALRLFDALGCRGVARFDFFVSADGLVLNEVNTIPGMTSTSQVPRMFAGLGLDYAALLDELVRTARTSAVSSRR